MARSLPPAVETQASQVVQASEAAGLAFLCVAQAD
jgi:hypothetical protein